MYEIHLHHLYSLLEISLLSVILQPLEVIKVRMQLSGIASRLPEFKNSVHLASKIVNTEGFLGLYRGGTSLVLKSYFCFAPNHIITCNALQAGDVESQRNLFKLYGPGYVVATFATPAELVHVRMSSDGRLPFHERRNYRSVFHAFSRIYREEGFFALWRGATPSMGVTGMNMAINTVNAMYATIHRINPFEVIGEDTFLSKHIRQEFITIGAQIAHVGITGFLISVLSLPMDMAKTRIQAMKCVDGIPEYTSTIDVIIEIIRKEGHKALWKGFLAYYIRIFPYSFVTMYVLSVCK